MEGDLVKLRTFIPVDRGQDPVYQLARLPRAEKDAEASVLFEDDWCLVLDKPAGMPVHTSAPGQRGTLDEAAIRCFGSGDYMPVKQIFIGWMMIQLGRVLYARNANWRN